MKSKLNQSLTAGALALGLTMSAFAADPAPTPQAPEQPVKEQRRMRVLHGEAGEPGDAPMARKEIRVRRHEQAAGPKEKVTFLGVETMPVNKTLIEQLQLPTGAGLVVRRVVTDSAAAAVLKPHDILLKFDDQILIDQHQLGVLTRTRKDGDEVTLTYVRAGKQATAKVKLTQREVPKHVDVLRHRIHGPGGGPLGHTQSFRMAPRGDRQHVERVLELMKRGGGPGRAPVNIRIDREKGPGVRAVSVDSGNSNLVFSDEAGSLELTIKGEEKTLVAKDATGKQQFSGPVGTPEQRQALPADVRSRLEALESMQDVAFHVGEDFEGAEMKVLDLEEEEEI